MENACETSVCVGTIGNWQLLSQDPVQAIVTPEPASLSLLASALFGFRRLDPLAQAPLAQARIS